MDALHLAAAPAAVACDALLAGGQGPSTVAAVSDMKFSAGEKRKRGRPPRGQIAAARPLPPRKMMEEEDVCFICFDGGSLVLCDRKGCPKAYHTTCIKRDESYFSSAAKWNCGWHICSVCQKSSHYLCYTCTYSLCKGCTTNADYFSVRGSKGFCSTCMKTIMLIENKDEVNKEKVQVDFDDKTTWEYLFKVYWMDLKGKLSFTLEELMQAKHLRKETPTASVIIGGGHVDLAEVRRESETSVATFSMENSTPVHSVENSTPVHSAENSTPLSEENSTPALSVGNSEPALSVENSTPDGVDSETEQLWFYRDPTRKVQGPFSMLQLSSWSKAGFFPPDLKVWKNGKHDQSLLLTDALRQQFHTASETPGDVMVQSTGPSDVVIRSTGPSDVVIRSTGPSDVVIQSTGPSDVVIQSMGLEGVSSDEKGSVGPHMDSSGSPSENEPTPRKNNRKRAWKNNEHDQSLLLTDTLRQQFHKAYETPGEVVIQSTGPGDVVIQSTGLEGDSSNDKGSVGPHRDSCGSLSENEQSPWKNNRRKVRKNNEHDQSLLLTDALGQQFHKASETPGNIVIQSMGLEGVSSDDKSSSGPHRDSSGSPSKNEPTPWNNNRRKVWKNNEHDQSVLLSDALHQQFHKASETPGNVVIQSMGLEGVSTDDKSSSGHHRDSSGSPSKNEPTPWNNNRRKVSKNNEHDQSVLLSDALHQQFHNPGNVVIQSMGLEGVSSDDKSSSGHHRDSSGSPSKNEPTPWNNNRRKVWKNNEHDQSVLLSDALHQQFHKASETPGNVVIQSKGLEGVSSDDKDSVGPHRDSSGSLSENELIPWKNNQRKVWKNNEHEQSLLFTDALHQQFHKASETPGNVVIQSMGLEGASADDKSSSAPHRDSSGSLSEDELTPWKNNRRKVWKNNEHDQSLLLSDALRHRASETPGNVVIQSMGPGDVVIQSMGLEGVSSDDKGSVGPHRDSSGSPIENEQTPVPAHQGIEKVCLENGSDECVRMEIDEPGTQSFLDLLNGSSSPSGKSQEHSPIHLSSHIQIHGQPEKRFEADEFHSWRANGNQNLCGNNIFQDHEMQSYSQGCSVQLSGQSWDSLPIAPSKPVHPATHFASLTIPNDLPEQNGRISFTALLTDSPNEVQAAEELLSLSSSFPIQRPNLQDLPSPSPSGEDHYGRAAETKEHSFSNLPVQDSLRSWSSASSLAVNEWDSGLVSNLPPKPPETLGDHVATPTSNTNHIPNSSPSHLTLNVCSWQPIEFTTLDEESVSDLLAEVDALESQSGLGSPASALRCGKEVIPKFKNEYFNFFEELSPMPDPAKGGTFNSLHCDR